ncbi:MAG: tRNA (N(6)-L-threonylcarbamoyladenosine(37)-C(2))-methylthiotransferase MtaB [Prevotellaceae bacterium]|nr:tRNA (N(6)-L-threonylcarbamoyladenosine(37)-C(2))-methylthiotransferase MtaB [Prevotellaceae bacterium]
MKTIAFITLGCKLNFSETSTIARQFSETEYQRVPASHLADIYVINTCTVTGEAEKKCRQIIRRVAKQNPEAQIIVTGCYANLRPAEIAEIPGVTMVIEDKLRVTGDELRVTSYNVSTTQPHCGLDPQSPLLQEMQEQVQHDEATAIPTVYSHSTVTRHPSLVTFFPAFSSGDRTRSFLKVQDGCDYHCSYCTVPIARGNSRNIAIDKLVKTAQTIAEQGIKEVVLTGVNIGDFGKSTGENFFDLLKALHKVEGIERYRISSIEPNLLTDEMLEWIAASDKILPHFHIPLQSGNNKVLGLMQRRYTRELFAQRLEKIYTVMPHAFIGVDVIVGFPGETIEDFEITYNFLESLSPAYLHIFPYSIRPETSAATFIGQLSEIEKKQRVEQLSILCRELHQSFYERHINYFDTVLFESTRKDGKMFGYTRNYLRVETPYQAALVGKIVPVRTTVVTEKGTMAVELKMNN